MRRVSMDQEKGFHGSREGIITSHAFREVRTIGSCIVHEKVRAEEAEDGPLFTRGCYIMLHTI